MNNHIIRWVFILGLIITITACTAANETPSSANTAVVSATDQGAIDPVTLFANNCARCHGADRSGKAGPALLPTRLNKDASQYAHTITNGSGGMPAFGNRLSAEEINALADWILTPPK